MIGRRKPYTQRGISRVPCARCGAPSTQQWQICADHRLFRGLCTACDVELNRLVLDFVHDPLADEKMDAYVQKLMRA